MSKIRLMCFVLAAVLCAGAGAYLYSTYSPSLKTIGYRLNTIGPLHVVRVADGDTLTVSGRFRGVHDVRLLGINTKELAHAGLRIKEECFGKEAWEYVRSLAAGNYATITFDPLKEISDDHGRLLGYIHIYSGYWSYVFQSGTDLNRHLIEKGYAEEWLYRGMYKRADEFLAAEKRARDEKAGGWAACPDFKKHPRAGSKERRTQKK